MSAEIRHMNEQSDSYRKGDADHARQSFLDWKERIIRNEDLWKDLKTPQQIEDENKRKELESLAVFVEMAHRNPQWHISYMFKELEWETFCLMNKHPYKPSWIGGVPGYWEYRERKAPEWVRKSRERLRNE